jgi:arylsulfatase A-like enzyme
MIDDYLPWLREKLGAPYVDYVDTGIGCNGYAVRPWVYDDMLHPTSWVTTQGIDFLRRRDPTRPFFLMLSYHRPHPPLDPPKCFLERYLQKELPPLPMGDWVDHELPTCRGLDSPVPRDPAQIDLARRAYYAQLSHIDQQVNRMVVALHEAGALQNTAILFTADHGDMLYDHNYIAKALPYDGSCRVPFILRLPGRNPWDGKPGQRVEAPVELRDLFPTFCDIAGAPVPEGLDGASVLPLLRGEERGWREYIHGEHVAGPQSNHWLTDGREKYAWFSQTGREQLFEIATDPQELHDMAPVRQDRVAYWRRRLIRELEGRPEGFVQEGKLVPGRPVSSTLEHAGIGV